MSAYKPLYYNGVTMDSMASQISSLTIVYSRLFGRKSKKASKFGVTGLCNGEFTGDRWIPRKNDQ